MWKVALEFSNPEKQEDWLSAKVKCRVKNVTVQGPLIQAPENGNAHRFISLCSGG